MAGPTLERAEAIWQEAEREQRFWQEHYQELLATYPDQYVAAKDGEVVAAAPDLEEMLTILQDLGISLRSVWIEFFTSEPQSMVL